MTASGESEKSVSQLGAQIRSFLCFLDQLLQSWFVDPVFQQLEISGYDGQQIVEVMSDAAGKLTNGVEFFEPSPTFARSREMPLPSVFARSSR